MATEDEVPSMLQAWKALAGKDSEYIHGNTYAAVYSILFDAESAPRVELTFAGKQPLLETCRLKDFDVDLLFQALQHHPALVYTIDLSYNPLTDASIACMLPYLKNPACSVTTLDLSYIDMTISGLENLATVLQLNRSIKTLHLNGCKIGRKGGIAIASMLQINSTIHTLELNSTDLETDSVIAMSTVLQGNRALKTVRLRRPLFHSLQEEPVIHLSRMLKVNFTLLELDLSTFSMSDTGAEWLCRGLMENSTLKILNLSNNKLSRDGAGHFAKLLSENPPLQQLNFSSNRIEDEGLMWISEALLRYNTNLTRLNVCYNNISDTGLCSLSKALQTNTTLKQVTIWGNKIGEPTCLEFYGLLRSGRLLPGNTDVDPYQVDGVNYLALAR